MLASKIINKLMIDGKKSTAQEIFYDALDMAEKRLEAQDQVEIFTKAIENIRPFVEVRSKRVGGANYQVPREVKRNRQQSLAIRWMVDYARKKTGKPMARRLAEELVDAYNGTGQAVQWKENVHKMAEANKAFAHYAR
jgi:small subunit ribosomal protein S7